VAGCPASPGAPATGRIYVYCALLHELYFNTFNTLSRASLYFELYDTLYRKMKKEPNRSVATLRKIIGKTQEQFAVMLGVSKDTIVSVENGRNRLSEPLAWRIYAATGANLGDLSEGSGRVGTGGNIFEPGSKEYTLDFFNKWRTEFIEETDSSYEARERAALKFFDDLKDWIEVLFVAAMLPGHKGKDRFPALMHSLDEWIDTAFEEFQLQRQVDEVLKKRSLKLIKKQERVAMARLYKKMDPAGYKFKDSKKLKEKDFVKVEYLDWVRWRGLFQKCPKRKTA
jgi:transcriptional regulator with XRE-family HTH domain